MGQMIAEMEFGRTDYEEELAVSATTNGEVDVQVSWSGDARFYTMTLAQSIQLRDFLNRHIDTLALASVGASTDRASDDPAQLPSEEVLP